MSPRHARTVLLTCHPDSPCSVPCSIEALVAPGADGLQLAFLLHADLAALQVAAPGEPRRAEGLWRHTCFELFVARPGEDAYQEFNFAPSLEWAGHAFSAYRRRSGDALAIPQVRCTRSSQLLQLEVALPLTGAWHAGLCAVVEDAQGTLSYWALRHAPGRPDFHHRDAFALELDEARP